MPPRPVGRAEAGEPDSAETMGEGQEKREIRPLPPRVTEYTPQRPASDPWRPGEVRDDPQAGGATVPEAFDEGVPPGAEVGGQEPREGRGEVPVALSADGTAVVPVSKPDGSAVWVGVVGANAADYEAGHGGGPGGRLLAVDVAETGDLPVRWSSASSSIPSRRHRVRSVRAVALLALSISLGVMGIAGYDQVSDGRLDALGYFTGAAARQAAPGDDLEPSSAPDLASDVDAGPASVASASGQGSRDQHKSRPKGAKPARLDQDRAQHAGVPNQHPSHATADATPEGPSSDPGRQADHGTANPTHGPNHGPTRAPGQTPTRPDPKPDETPTGGANPSPTKPKPTRAPTPVKPSPTPSAGTRLSASAHGGGSDGQFSLSVDVDTDAPSASINVSISGAQSLTATGTVNGSGRWTKSFTPGPGTYHVTVTVRTKTMTANPSTLTITV
jgi:hypothetical protein